MDPIIIGIIVTILTICTALVFIFKRDFDYRPTSNHPTSSSKSANKSSASSKLANTSSQSCKKSNHSKQVHFAEVLSTSSDEADNQIHSKGNQATVQPPKVNKNGANGQSKGVKNKNKSQENGHIANNNNNNELAVSTNNKELTADSFNTQTNKPRDPEPSSDELDSSVLLEVFNPAKTGANLTNKIKQSGSSQQFINGTDRSQLAGRSQRRRQNSEQASYSSEKLFSMIAASNLCKDEVEMAVEILLNKLESGESDWHQPKSDPIQRLKSQLRDSECALTTETQNHRQTRARLSELKSELQNERSAKNSINEELARLRRDVGLVNAALDKAHLDLSKQRFSTEQMKEESTRMISKLEKENVHLQSLLGKSRGQDDEVLNLRRELADKSAQLKHYELSNQTFSQRVQELENGLRNSEMKLEQLRSSKQHDDYEACAKISELEADRLALDKVLKDHVARLKELTETNSLLGKSVKELQIMNGRQDDMLKRLRDERHVNEVSMKRTLCEMEQELRELQEKLSAKTVTTDHMIRKEIDQFERELSDAGEREQRLANKMKQLRQGLSELFPDLIKGASDQNVASQNGPDDWVHQYLVALKQLAKTVNELRERSNDSNNNTNQLNDNLSTRSVSVSPSGRSLADKSTTTSSTLTNGSRLSPRIGSPTSNGRSSSRASSRLDPDRKMMETKLVESNDQSEELIQQIKELKEELEKANSMRPNYEQQIKNLLLQRSKLEAQVKFGVDSLKREQKANMELMLELSKETKAPCDLNAS